MATYNIDEACRLSGISVRSLRNYVHHYGDHLHIERGPYNSLIFSDKSLSVLVKIKALLRDGNNRHTICDLLKEEESQPTIKVTRTENLPVADNQALLQVIHKVDSTLAILLEENKVLHNRLIHLESELARTQRVLPEADSYANRLQQTPSRKNNRLEIPLPHSLLSLKDGCVALIRSFATMLTRKKASPARS